MRNCTKSRFSNIPYNHLYKDSHTYTDQSHNYWPWRFRYYVIPRRFSLNNNDYTLLISVTQIHSFLSLYIFTSLTQYLSVADNERDAVLLHVSAASERQEQRIETGTMTKITERNILDFKLSPSSEFCMLSSR